MIKSFILTLGKEIRHGRKEYLLFRGENIYNDVTTIFSLDSCSIGKLYGTSHS